MKLFKRGKSKKGAKEASAVVDSDSDDISLMSEDSDWEAERAALHQTLSGKAQLSAGGAGADPFEHASLWAEVGCQRARSLRARNLLSAHVITSAAAVVAVMYWFCRAPASSLLLPPSSETPF